MGTLMGGWLLWRGRVRKGRVERWRTWRCRGQWPWRTTLLSLLMTTLVSLQLVPLLLQLIPLLFLFRCSRCTIEMKPSRRRCAGMNGQGGGCKERAKALAGYLGLRMVLVLVMVLAAGSTKMAVAASGVKRARRLMDRGKSAVRPNRWRVGWRRGRTCLSVSRLPSCAARERVRRGRKERDRASAWKEDCRKK